MRHTTKQTYSQYRKDGKFGISDDLTQQIIIPAEYDFTSPEIYDDKLVQVQKNGKYGFVDFNNKIVIPIEYESVREFKDGLAPIRIDGFWGYIDNNNKITIQPHKDWKWVTLFNNDSAVVRINDNDYYYIDREGNYKNKEPFTSAGCFKDGFAVASRENEPLPFNNELSIINSDFKTILDDKFNQIEYLGEFIFKVVKRLDKSGRTKTGIYEVGKGIIWRKETDKLNIWLDKIENLQSQFKTRLDKADCLCQFPRIVDYITRRAHYDRDILRNIAFERLRFTEKKELDSYENDSIYKCDKCNSEYLVMTRTNPRGEPDTAGFRQIKDCCETKVGADIKKEVPVAIIHYGPLGKYDGDLHLQKFMYYDTIDNLIKYLFEKKSEKAVKTTILKRIFRNND